MANHVISGHSRAVFAQARTSASDSTFFAYIETRLTPMSSRWRPLKHGFSSWSAFAATPKVTRETAPRAEIFRGADGGPELFIFSPDKIFTRTITPAPITPKSRFHSTAFLAEWLQTCLCCVWLLFLASLPFTDNLSESSQCNSRLIRSKLRKEKKTTTLASSLTLTQSP